MTDENKQNQEEVASAENVPAPEKKAEQAQPEEKLVKQSVMNDVVGTAKREAYEKGKKEVYEEVQKQIQAAAQPEVPPAQQPAAVSEDKVNLSSEEVRKLIAEEAEKEATRKTAETVVNSFITKMQGGYDKYSDFEEKVRELNIPNLPPQVIHWVTQLDNTADVMYELAKNPAKFGNVLTLSMASPNLAQKAFNDLSSSIKQNQDATQKGENTNVQEPLDQINPSVTGTDNGNLGVSDLRKLDYLRG